MQDDNSQNQQSKSVVQLPPLPHQQQLQVDQPQQQQLSNMSTTSSSRHYVDKARLIKLVHENPILWDCRLPNYKRADKSKTDQWNSLGAIFNVSGERVQRTFTSLREIFRRELNNEKLLGRRFKSKWEFYKSMSFLRDVIRERKPRERHPTKLSRRNQLSPSVNNNPPSNSNGIDEYQYFAPNDPNNPSLQQQQKQHQQQQQQQQHMQSATLANNDKTTSAIAKPDMTQIALANNNSQLSVLSLLTQLNNGAQQQAQQQQQQQQQQKSNHKPIVRNDNENDDDDDINIVQPSPASSTTPSMYIKDEIEIPDEDDDDDEEDTPSITFNGEILYSNNNKINIVNSNAVKNVEDENGRSKRRTKLGRNSTKIWKRLSKNSQNDCEILEDDDDEDDIDVDDDELTSVESLTNANVTNNCNKIKISHGNGVVNNLNDETKLNHDLMQEHLSSVSCIGGVPGVGVGVGVSVAGGVGGNGVGVSVGVGSGSGGSIGNTGGEAEVKYRRHLVYTKFADFIVAKMDAMCERDADDLMDRLMLVIAQKH